MYITERNSAKWKLIALCYFRLDNKEFTFRTVDKLILLINDKKAIHESQVIAAMFGKFFLNTTGKSEVEYIIHDLASKKSSDRWYMIGYPEISS